MAINFELKQNRLPQFDFKLPFPQTPIDYLDFSYEMAKNGEALVLTVKIKYELEDFDTKERYEVTKYNSVYEVLPMEEILTPAKLYMVCKSAAETLNSCLEFLVECKEVPPKTISCPPICHLQADLQKIIEWYHGQQPVEKSL